MLNFFYGTDVYLAKKEAKRILPNASWKYEGFSVEVLRNLNIFGRTQEVWVVEDLKANSEVFIAASEVALSDVCDLVVVVLGAAPKNLKVTKALLKGQSKEFKALDPWDRKGIVGLIKNLASDYGFKPKPKTAEVLAYTFGADSGNIDCHLAKVAAIYPEGFGDKEVLGCLSDGSVDNVFDFVDAVLDFNLKESLRLLYQIDDPPIKIASLLATKAHNVWCVSLGVSAPISPAQEGFFKRKYTKSSDKYLSILSELQRYSYPTKEDLVSVVYKVIGG